MFKFKAFLAAGALAAALACQAGSEAAGKKLIVCVGDSTVASYKSGEKVGWGQVLGELLNGEVEISNLAASGRSSKTFINEGRWDSAIKKKPDFVLVQFGHNDNHGKAKPESTDAATDYKDYLRKYVDDVKASGGVPVLITPMHRRSFSSDGKTCSSELKPYADAMKEVAKEREAACVDLYSLSGALFERLGEEGCADLFASPSDRTHFSMKGAQAMAKLIVEELVRSKSPLAKFAK